MKYIGIFDSSENVDENRIKHMSSGNKMIYVSESLKELGHDVDIISPSWTLNRKFYKGKAKVLEPGINVVLGPTIPYIRGISQVLAMVWLTLYLLFNTKKYETIIVYHSLFLILPIKILQYFKKINLILQVEEIYSEVVKKQRRNNNREIKFINNADYRILVSNQLKNKIGIEGDIVLYGSYKNNLNLEIIKENKSLVYAGSIEKLKNGAFNAVEMMRFISDKNIKLYILGTGSKTNILKLESMITEINNMKQREAIIFLGEKDGDEYNELMNSFSIGLNLQNSGSYMDTAFPSKIIAYLSYNQKIISTNIASIKNSPFEEFIDFVYVNNLNETAKEIEIVANKIEAENKELTVIDHFDNKFKEDLKVILNYNN